MAGFAILNYKRTESVQVTISSIRSPTVLLSMEYRLKGELGSSLSKGPTSPEKRREAKKKWQSGEFATGPPVHTRTRVLHRRSLRRMRFHRAFDQSLDDCPVSIPCVEDWWSLLPCHRRVFFASSLRAWCFVVLSLPVYVFLCVCFFILPSCLFMFYICSVHSLGFNEFC